MFITLSTLFPTRILTTELETYVSSSLYHRGSASKDSRLDTSYTKIERVELIDALDNREGSYQGLFLGLLDSKMM